MDSFEDDNPFQDVVSDDAVVPSDTSSISKMDLSEPQSPQSALNNPQTPRPTLPSPQNLLQNTVRSEICCARDRDIQSGEDFEILVSSRPFRL
jgi:sorting nexin-41/42